jgi:CheY-like chemotaxis protein
MAKARIFVADDDTIFLALMQDFLEGEGYSVSVWHTGDRVHQQIKKAFPDLVVLDIILEQPDAGWKILDTLKQDLQTMHIPVVICSVDVGSLRGRKDELDSLGVVAVEKPFDLETMHAAIRQALSPQ